MKSKERYHYRECGLDSVYLRNGFERQPTKYGETITIHNIDGLHRAIGLYLIGKKKPLSGREFRFLRHELGFSQTTLGRLLGKSGQSVARWEKDQCAIDSTADRLLRVIYELKATSSSKSKISRLLEELAEYDSIDVGSVQFVEDKQGWQQEELVA